MSSDLNKGIAKGLSYLDSICSDQDFIAIHYDFDIPITAKFWRQYPNVARMNPFFLNSDLKSWYSNRKVNSTIVNIWILFKNKELSSKYLKKLDILEEKSEVILISKDVTLVKRFN